MIMNHPDLMDHLTAPSTIRGIIWAFGALVALYMIHKGDSKGATEVIAQAGLAVGAVGMFTREPCSRRRADEDPNGAG